MIKKILFSIVLLYFGFTYAQTEIALTKKYTTVLIFPSEIDGDPIIGNDSEFLIIPNKQQTPISKRTLKLEYNTDGNGKTKTNLIVFTVDGFSYEYILKYSATPDQTLYKINVSDAVDNISSSNNIVSHNVSTNETFNPIAMQNVKERETPKDTEFTHVKDLCVKTQFIKKKLVGVFDKSYGVKLSLKRVSHDKDKLYLHLLFQNNGVQAYDVELVSYLKGTSNEESSFKQDPEIKPYYVLNEPKRIEGRSDLHYVVVFDSLTIDENKQIVLKIKELNGERDISLTVEDKIINNPLKLKS